MLSDALDQTPPVAVVHAPVWLRRPTGRDIARVYPMAAEGKELDGSATLNCSVLATGSLTDCQISDERPVGEGFGAAALKLSPLFKMGDRGNPIAGGKVRIPIRFRLPPAYAIKVTIRSSEFVGKTVQVDCRLSSQRLDNCFAMTPDKQVADMSSQFLEGRNLSVPSASTGRIIVTVEFVAEAPPPSAP